MVVSLSISLPGNLTAPLGNVPPHRRTFFLPRKVRFVLGTSMFCDGKVVPVAGKPKSTFFSRDVGRAGAEYL